MNTITAPTNPKITPEIQAQLNNARSLIGAGLDSIMAAGTIMANLVNNVGLTIEEIVESYGVDDDLENSLYLIKSLVRIGNKQMHPSLLFATSASARAISELSYPDQTRILAAGSVEVAVPSADGRNVDILHVKLPSLTPNQVKQVFTKKEIREPGAQRAWLADRAAFEARKATKKMAGASNYHVSKKGELVIPAAGLTLGISTVRALLDQMEATARKK